MAGDGYDYCTISIKEETRDRLRDIKEDLNEDYSGMYIKYDDLIRFFLSLKDDREINPARLKGR